MSKWYNEKDNHAIARNLLKLGFKNFSYGKSSSLLTNGRSTWYIEELENKQVSIWLGESIKSSLICLKTYVKEYIPFVKPKLLLTCSGGETSMFMVIWCWRNLQDKYDMKIVFANTGQEEDATLDFIVKSMKKFNLPVDWIEPVVHHGKRKGCTHKFVTVDEATRKYDWKYRDDTPFEEVVKKYGIPNHSRLHCTRELKMNPIKSYAKSFWGKEKYTLALGIRMDEMDRVNSKHKDLGLLYPLISGSYQPMTKKHINFWWSQQEFRLNLKGYQGNCITCYKKSKNKILTLINENKEDFKFFKYIESKYGNPNGKIPKKIQYEYLNEEGNLATGFEMEKLDKKEYKNVFFRNFQSVEELIEEAKKFDKNIKDDHVETESCEIFSGCGEDI